MNRFQLSSHSGKVAVNAGLTTGTFLDNRSNHAIDTIQSVSVEVSDLFSRKPLICSNSRYASDAFRAMGNAASVSMSGMSAQA